MLCDPPPRIASVRRSDRNGRGDYFWHGMNMNHDGYRRDYKGEGRGECGAMGKWGGAGGGVW